MEKLQNHCAPYSHEDFCVEKYERKDWESNCQHKSSPVCVVPEIFESHTICTRVQYSNLSVDFLSKHGQLDPHILIRSCLIHVLIK